MTFETVSCFGSGAEHLFLNELTGPESLAFGPKKELYLRYNPPPTYLQMSTPTRQSKRCYL